MGRSAATTTAVGRQSATVLKLKKPRCRRRPGVGSPMMNAEGGVEKAKRSLGFDAWSPCRQRRAWLEESQVVVDEAVD